MKLGPWASNLLLFIVAFAVAIFTLGYTYFSLVVSIVVLFLAYPTLKIPRKLFLFYGIILLSGTLIGIIMMGFDLYPDKETQRILLRTRFFWIRVLFATSVVVYLMNQTYKDVLRFAFAIMMIQLVSGLFELIFMDTLRISMLTSEPSAAAMYYVFLVPLMIEYYKLEKKARVWIILYAIVGLFIQSKAQILIIPLLIAYLVIKSKNQNLKLLAAVGILVIIVAVPVILGIREVDRLVYFIEILKDQGLSGLTEQNKIWSTFTLRFSSVITAFQLLWEHPFGLGFGGFHSMYIDKMLSGTLQGQLTGTEIRGILEGELYATPKSMLMEYMVSCGLFFLIPLILLVRRYIKSEVPVGIKASLYAVILISLIVELSPFLTFLGINFVLFHQLKNQDPTYHSDTI